MLVILCLFSVPVFTGRPFGTRLANLLNPDHQLHVSGAEDSPVVTRLATLLDSDPQLKASVQFTLSNVPEKYAHYFGNRSIAGLLNFFDRWVDSPVFPSQDCLSLTLPSRFTEPPLISQNVTKPQTTPDPLSFISPMWQLASSTDNAVWLRDPQIIEWLQLFIKSRVSLSLSPSLSLSLSLCLSLSCHVKSYVTGHVHGLCCILEPNNRKSLAGGSEFQSIHSTNGRVLYFQCLFYTPNKARTSTCE